MEDMICYVLYVIAFMVILHVFWTNRNTATGIFMEEEKEEESWWPWRITTYNEWPNWMRSMKSERVSDSKQKDLKADLNALPKASMARPWGDPSARSANGMH